MNPMKPKGRTACGTGDRGRPVALAMGICFLACPLFLASAPYGLFELLQDLLPRNAAGAMQTIRAWTFAGGLPFSLQELSFVFLSGLFAGSFLNVVISRTPPREVALARARAWLELGYDQAADRELAGLPPDFATGRSRCIHCRRPIPAWLLIPVAGWLRLRGRSACCGRPIPARYPAVELLTAFLFTAVAWRFGADHMLPAALVLTGALVALAVIDIEHLILPDALVLPLLWYGLACNLHGGFVPLEQAVAGAIAGFLLFSMIRQGHAMATGRIGIGYGDCKLAACIGAWSGAAGLLQVAILASGAAFTVHGFLAVIGKGSTDRYLAFGPWLAGAAVFWLLFPDAILRIFHVPLYT